MRRSVTAGLAATAIVVVLSGCSGNTSPSGRSSGSSSGPGAADGASTAKVTVDGKDRNVHGTVACTTAAGDVDITVGGSSTGIGAVLTDASPPSVKSVGLGDVDGVALGYTPVVPGSASARATKDGSRYRITGTATGVDMANPAQPVNKSFEIDVACP